MSLVRALSVFLEWRVGLSPIDTVGISCPYELQGTVSVKRGLNCYMQYTSMILSLSSLLWRVLAATKSLGGGIHQHPGLPAIH